MHEPPAATLANRMTGRFYDWAGWLYPLIEPWMAPGRSRCIERINQEAPGNLLEIGAGPGRHLASFSTHRVSAIDVSGSMVRSCRHRCPGARIWVMDGECTEFADGSFDVVALFHVLTVTARPGRMLQEVHRLLRPGGRVYILNRESGDSRVGWINRVFDPFARALRLRLEFQLDDCPEIRMFKRLDRWSYGPFGMFTGTLLIK